MMVSAMCACTGRCKQPPFTCNGMPPGWEYQATWNQPRPLLDPRKVTDILGDPRRHVQWPPLRDKPRYRVKAGRQVVA